MAVTHFDSFKDHLRTLHYSQTSKKLQKCKLCFEYQDFNLILKYVVHNDKWTASVTRVFIIFVEFWNIRFEIQSKSWNVYFTIVCVMCMLVWYGMVYNGTWSNGTWEHVMSQIVSNVVPSFWNNLYSSTTNIPE